MHWTYRPVEDDEDLAQGDVLLPTSALQDVFAEVHPHFADPKYLGFMVVSQSCDLVRRGPTGRCATPYVSVAVIRPLDQVLVSLLDLVCKPVADGVYQLSDRQRAIDFLRRLLNQNEWKLGLFYLHADDEVGFADHAVAVLRVKVALREVHYGTLLDARCGRLHPEFANKLGWMVGNLYSRIGTDDWQDQEGGDSRLKDLIREFLAKAEDAQGEVVWAPEDRFRAACKEGLEPSTATRLEIREALNAVTLETPIDRALGAIEVEAGRILRDIHYTYEGEDAEVARVIGDTLLRKITNRLRNNAVFKSSIHDPARNIVE